MTNHVEKLLGHNKMVDEINYFVHRCHGKEFCTTYRGGLAPT